MIFRSQAIRDLILVTVVGLFFALITYAGSLTPSAAPASTMRDLSTISAKSTDGFSQNDDSLEAISEKLGENTADNTYISTTVASNRDGSLLERLEYIIADAGFATKAGTETLTNKIISTDSSWAGSPITSTYIQDGTITTDDIGLDTIAANNLAVGSVTSSEILDGTITTDDIGLDTITANDLAVGSVTSSEILDGTITTDDIIMGGLASSAILDSTITNSDLSAGPFTKITGVGTLTSLTVGGNIIANVDDFGGGGSSGLCWTGSESSATIYDCSSAPSDLAENFGTADPSITAGDLVVLAGEATPVEIHVGTSTIKSSKAWIAKAKTPYDPRLLGVISTQPNTLYGDDGLFAAREHPRPVSLVGRVPVKVSAINGSIVLGDRLTSSTIPGVAMKATESGPVVGIALQSWRGSGTGTIIMLVQPGWR